jgi:hypothetical protein
VAKLALDGLAAGQRVQRGLAGGVAALYPGLS